MLRYHAYTDDNCFVGSADSIVAAWKLLVVDGWRTRLGYLIDTNPTLPPVWGELMNVGE